MNMIHASKNGLCNPCFGESHYIAKLTDDIVKIIWIMYMDGYKTKYIHEYITDMGINISESALKQIKHKRAWRHVTDTL